MSAWKTFQNFEAAAVAFLLIREIASFRDAFWHSEKGPGRLVRPITSDTMAAINACLFSPYALADVRGGPLDGADVTGGPLLALRPTADGAR